jgi:23S rRNA (pseudouridine1915-N3)-methyltransferase
MRISIAAIGKLKKGPEHDLVGQYLERAQATGKQIGLSGFDISEYVEARGNNADQRKADEAKLLLSGLEDGAKLIALDERGKSITSPQFSTHIMQLRDDGCRALHFVIGGPDGLDKSVRQRADLVLSFSPLTWPHQIVRALLCEQIYRAITISTGHPYHRV